jgi:hypothetical protein
MTLTDLYTAALQEIGVLASGEVAEADDRDKVREKYIGLYALLESKDWVEWGEEDEIPSWAEIPVTYMLAFLCAPAFGISGQKRIELGALGALDSPQPSIAERMMRKQMSKRYYSQTSRTEYF